jgi:hypothetical protein
VRGIDLPGHEELVKDLEAALCEVEGVCWAAVNSSLGRVVVAYGESGPALDNLIEVVGGVEARYEVGNAPFPKGRPEHPGDIEPLRRAAVALGADVVGLWASVFGQLLRTTPFPVELASLVSLADQQPRVREYLERLLGVPGTDLGLGLASAMFQAVAQGPFGLAIDIAQRIHQLSELQARRAAWERLEPELCAVPAAAKSPAVRTETRPVRLRDGPVERYADRTTLVSLGAGALTLAVTGSMRRSAGMLVAGVPKASRMGRETFAAVIGRDLARREALVLDHRALRRLDRIDVAVLDARALLGPPIVASLTTVGRDKEIRTVLSELFDPRSPGKMLHHGPWVVGPLPRLRRLGITVPATLSGIAKQVPDEANVLGVAHGSTTMGLATLDANLDPLAQPLVRAVRRAGLELVVAGGPSWLAEELGAERRVAGGVRLARSLR